MTYETWVNQYFSLYCRKLKPRTIESYQHAVSIMPALAAMELEAMTPDGIQQQLNEVEDLHGGRMAQICFALLSKSMKRARRSHHIAANPVEDVDKPQHTKQPGRALDRNAMAAVEPLISDDIGLSLCLYAGLRRGEVCGLHWSDVNLRAGTITIRRQLMRVGRKLTEAPPKSKAGLRTIPLHPILRELLRSSWVLAPDAPVVGISPEALGRHWRSTQARAGLSGYRLHDLRHTYATNLVLCGCNMKVLQYLMGHSSIELTLNTYSHVDSLAATNELRRIALH